MLGQTGMTRVMLNKTGAVPESSRVSRWEPTLHTAPTSFGGLSQKTQGCRVAPKRSCWGVQRARSGSGDGEPLPRLSIAARLQRLVVVLLGKVVQRNALFPAVELHEARDAELVAGLRERHRPPFYPGEGLLAVRVGLLRHDLATLVEHQV